MAKQVGLFGNWTGKLANTVGYRIPLSANKITQGVRAYQPIVANPKTEAQATQRMKMTAAVNFYRQLQVILNNAWQGQKYGSKSRQYFMSMAMSQVAGIPFVDKGDKRFYPGEYKVSQGSIPSQGVTAINQAGILTTTLGVPADGDITSNWGAYSQTLINGNFGLRNGDKLTFISVIRQNGEYLPAYTYVVLNTESTDAVADVLAASNLQFTIMSVDGSPLLGFSIVGHVGANDSTVAGAVIVSRYPQSGATWERSTATMFCTAAYKANMMGADRYAAAAATYLASASSLSSDWYLNYGLNGSDAVTPSGGSSDSNVQVTSVANRQFTLNNGSSQTDNYNVAILTYSDGTKKAAKASNDMAAYTSGSGYAAYSNVPANAANLTIIQGVDSNVTGWILVDATLPSSGDPIEERP